MDIRLAAIMAICPEVFAEYKVEYLKILKLKLTAPEDSRCKGVIWKRFIDTLKVIATELEGHNYEYYDVPFVTVLCDWRDSWDPER